MINALVYKMRIVQAPSISKVQIIGDSQPHHPTNSSSPKPLVPVQETIKPERQDFTF